MEHPGIAADRKMPRATAPRGGAAILVAGILMLMPAMSGAAPPRPLAVLNDADAPPFTAPDGSGFFDAVATEAFRRAGLDLRLVNVPAERALLLSNSGASDGELNRLAGMEKLYPNLVRVPESLGDWQFVAFGKDPSIHTRFEALSGRAVGFVRGWKVYERKTAGMAGTIAVDDADQLFRLLQLDRIDAALYERSMGLAYLRKHRIVGVKVLDPAFFSLPTFIYLHKSRAAWVPALAAALRAMKRDGFHRRAYRERLLPLVRTGLP